MDIGGHRFFSKSDRVMQWWMELMPPDATEETPISYQVSYQGKTRVVAVPAKLEEEPVLRGIGEPHPVTVDEDSEQEPHPETLVVAPEPVNADLVMLIRPRKSRIYFLRKFFDYPITLTAKAPSNLGAVGRRGWKCELSGYSRVKQITPEKSLEDFLINRFGRHLYLTFFASYTEKVWGICANRSVREWGAQRIKGLSLTTAVKHFVKKSLGIDKKRADLSQKGTDTSLIERFLYPKFGPGQLWEHVAEKVRAGGGEIHMGWTVDRVHVEGPRVVSTRG